MPIRRPGRRPGAVRSQYRPPGGDRGRGVDRRLQDQPPAAGNRGCGGAGSISGRWRLPRGAARRLYPDLEVRLCPLVGPYRTAPDAISRMRCSTPTLTLDRRFAGPLGIPGPTHRPQRGPPASPVCSGTKPIEPSRQRQRTPRLSEQDVLKVAVKPVLVPTFWAELVAARARMIGPALRGPLPATIADELHDRQGNIDGNPPGRRIRAYGVRGIPDVDCCSKTGQPWAATQDRRPPNSRCSSGIARCCSAGRSGPNHSDPTPRLCPGGAVRVFLCRILRCREERGVPLIRLPHSRPPNMRAPSRQGTHAGRRIDLHRIDHRNRLAHSPSPRATQGLVYRVGQPVPDGRPGRRSGGKQHRDVARCCRRVIAARSLSWTIRHNLVHVVSVLLFCSDHR